MDKVAKCNEFVKCVGQVKTYNAAKVLPHMYETFRDLFAEMGWQVADVNEMKGKLYALSAAAAATVMESRQNKGEIRKKVISRKGERVSVTSGNYIAKGFDEKGNLGTYRAEETDENGAKVEVDREMHKAFETYSKAQDWLFRNLAERGGPGWTGTVEDTRFPQLSGTFTRDQAIAATWGKRKVGPAMHTNKTDVNGPWMRCRSDHSSFSRG
jgi:hypothetical protein